MDANDQLREYGYAKKSYSTSSRIRFYNQIRSFEVAVNLITISFSATEGPQNAVALKQCIAKVQRILIRRFGVKGYRALEFKVRTTSSGRCVYPHLHLVVDKAICYEHLNAELVRAFPWFCSGQSIRFQPLKFSKIESLERAAKYVSKSETKAVSTKFVGITRVRAKFGFSRSSRDGAKRLDSFPFPTRDLSV